MFLRIHQHSIMGPLVAQSLEHAQAYIQHAKINALRYAKYPKECAGFLCGNAGIYAVSIAISNVTKSIDLDNDIEQYVKGFNACLPIKFNKNGSDELLFGRAGFLSGIYWLNQLKVNTFISNEQINKMCNTMIESGRHYSKDHKSATPLLYHCWEQEYLGAAHGLSSILHMILESSWFQKDDKMEFPNVDSNVLRDITKSLDIFLSMQDEEGNFPVTIEDSEENRKGANELVHWCHGAPGAVYVLAKAYLIFDDIKYLTACKKAADCIWQKGLLYKGPGICHGIAGNGYTFLLLYRLTQDPKYLYRAEKFMEFLSNDNFINKSRIPDRPDSLYEGIAGTVCFLMDLLEPQNSSFPFMDVFDVKYSTF